jgi:hypothetical protein
LNSNAIQLGDRTIGNGQPCFVIAEAGLNHNGELRIAKLLIDVAVLAGADAAGISGEGLQIGDGEIDFEALWRLIGGLDVVFVPEIWQGHKFGGEGFLVALKRLADIAARVDNNRNRK